MVQWLISGEYSDINIVIGGQYSIIYDDVDARRDSEASAYDHYHYIDVDRIKADSNDVWHLTCILTCRSMTVIYRSMGGQLHMCNQLMNVI